VSIPESLSRLLRALVEVEEQPALAELKAEVGRLERRHRGHRESPNEALMALYKEHKVNPAEACLPYLLQVLPGLVSSCVLSGPALRDRSTRGCMIGRPAQLSLTWAIDSAGAHDELVLCHYLKLDRAR
jgi:hypothetical protein